MKKTSKLAPLLTVLLLMLCIGGGALLPRFLRPVGTPLPPEQLLTGVGLQISGQQLAAEDGDAQQQTITALLQFAEKQGISTLYYAPAPEEGTAVLRALCSEAGDQVGIVVLLPKGSEAETVTATEKYLLPGGYLVQYQGAATEALLQQLQTLTEYPIGVQYDGSAAASEALLPLAEDKLADWLAPQLSGQVDDDHIAAVKLWSESEAVILPMALAETDRDALSYQLFYHTVCDVTAGYILQGTPDLLEDTLSLQELMSYADAPAAALPDELDLAVSQSLQVAYPADGAVTSASSVFVMGTSDPDEVLTVNGTEVGRLGSRGCFGTAVSLKNGKNTITLRQGENILKLTVTRSSYTGDGTTNTVTSRFPTADAITWAGETLTFRCVAPSGSKVVATVNGKKVTMQQTVATAKKGIAATYKGTYQVPATLPAGEITDLGPITYTMTYSGSTKVLESAGRLYAAGKGATPMIYADTENVSVLKDYKDDSTILATYHLGARIPVEGCFQSDGSIFYEVAGGYIASDRVSVSPQAYPKDTVVEDITSVTEGRLTTVTFRCGNAPAATAVRQEDALLLTLENTTLPQELSGLQSPLIAAVQQKVTNGNTELTLTLADPAHFWGYDIQYTENGDLLLSLKAAPTRSTVPGKPLSGITVMVDPGHGHSDPGALGAAGAAGPVESELNLAVSLALQQRLQQLGATVLMTRTTDDPAANKVVLDERVRMAVEAKPDFFISVHHNSTGLTKEVTADWMEVYYHEAESLPFAETLREKMMAATGRAASEPSRGYFYVTRLTFCPSVLYEVGFLPNPAQYEDCADPMSIYRSGWALAEGVLASVPQN